MNDDSMIDVDLHAGIGYDTFGIDGYVFNRLAFGRGLVLQLGDAWKTLVSPEQPIPAAIFGMGRVLREDHEGKNREVELLLDVDGILLRIDVKRSANSVVIRIASTKDDEARARALLEQIRSLFPVLKGGGDSAPIAFWAADKRTGAHSRSRPISIVEWDTIARNYPSKTREQLGRVISDFKPEDGRLLLWQGEPGTGKTTAIRALAHEWRTWCWFEYVTDPEEFFGSSSYMMEVLLDYDPDEGPADWHDGEPWRCLVLEDTGELLVADAKTNEGQRLSRFLNVVDGLIGQGLKILVLVTTNEEIGSLHPAVSRPGRCAEVVRFERFTREEAESWLRDHAVHTSLSSGLSLAELYALNAGRKLPRPAAVGFLV